MSRFPLDETHDPAATSWVVGAAEPDTDFPLQNLPFCAFSVGTETPRIGVGIGRMVLDITAAAEAGLLDLAEAEAAACAHPVLNPLMAMGPAAWQRLRRALFRLLHRDAPAPWRTEAAVSCLVPMAGLRFHLPVAIGDYTDFYASIDHATNVGRMFRPDQPLLPNYKYVPIGYHGRASSISADNRPVHRPAGQRKRPDDAEPSFGPCRQLDWELELGFLIGTGNAQGESIAIEQAGAHLFGVTLLNDWSARDLQAWEYQPLGPFLAKNFATSIGPFVVTMAALAPFRIPAHVRPESDPAPLPYLFDPADQAEGGFAIDVSVELRSATMRAASGQFDHITTVGFQHMYWTAAQMVAHHSSNGCNLQPGDLLGSGTISTPDPAAVGSLLELTRRGQAPITLSSGETRSFLQDGDEVRMTARAHRDGARSIGFGRCEAVIVG
ncbi:MAG: fumarylacetoacetase [Alphaproteobacteria bacterium]|nr:fumarylacetoacetase [Alphaproteobacteria bacterium]